MLKIVPLEEDLVRSILDSLLAVEDGDWSRTVVVLPSRRLGLFLQDALACQQKKSHLPPEIMMVDDFVYSLFTANYPGFTLLTDMEATLQLYRVLSREEKKTLYTGPVRSGDFPGFFPWGLRIQQALEEIVVESRDFHSLDPEIFTQFVSLGDYHQQYRDFIRSLPTLLTSYLDTLYRNRRATRGSMYRILGDRAGEGDLEVLPGNTFLFAGFNALNYSEERILRFFFEKHSADLILRSDPAAIEDSTAPFALQTKTLRALDLSLPGKSGVGNSTSWNRFASKVRLLPCTNTETEMNQVFEVLQTLVRDRPPERLREIGVVMPEASSLIPFVQGVISRFDQEQNPVPFNITLGYPFKRTPLYQLIDLLLRVGESRQAGTLSSRDYLSLIRHPYVKLCASSPQNQGPLRAGIHSIEDIINVHNLVTVQPDELLEALRTHPLLSAGSGIDKHQVLREVEGIHRRFLIEPDLDFGSLCENLIQAISGIEPENPQKSYLFLGEYTKRAIQAFEELREFYGSVNTAFAESDFCGFAGFIRYYFSEMKIHFTGSPLRGIQVMGMLEFRGLKFDQVLVLDTLEGVLPQTLKYDPLLPHDVKQVFHMRTYTDWDQLFAFNFFSLVGASRSSWVFWTENQEGGEKGEKSRFIERMIYETAGEGNELPLVRKRVGLSIRDIPPRSVRKSSWVSGRLSEMSFSPSSIDMYVRCPLRFYFERVLKLRERETVETDPDAGIFGSIIHGILEDFFRPLLQSTVLSCDRREIRERLKPLVRRRFRKKNYDVDRGIMKIRAWVVLEKLTDFLAGDLQRLKRDAMVVTGLEQPVDGTLKLRNGIMVRIRGFLDRRTESEGQVRIVDYKTGSDSWFSAPALRDSPYPPLLRRSGGEYLDGLGEFGERFPGLQLLTYLLLITGKGEPPVEQVDAEYIFLRKESGWFRNVFQLDRDRVMESRQRADYIEEYREALGLLFEDLFQRDYFQPNPRDDRYCKYCPFDTLCGCG